MNLETYYFDFDDGARSTKDADGLPLPDADAARVEALQALAEILLHRPSHIDPKLTCTVRTGDGALVYVAALPLQGHRADGSASPVPM